VAGTRVCYLLKRFPRLSQTFVLNELLELERQGVDVVVVAREPSDESVGNSRVVSLRAEVHYLPSASPDAIAALVTAQQPTHVHAHFATWGAEAALAVHRRTGLPYSFTAHATDIYRAALDGDALIERMAAARAVVTVSDANRQHLESLLAAAGRDGVVRRIYNGIDLEALRPDPLSRQQGLVVSVGRLIEKKGFPDLVAAMSRLGVDVECVIAGDGPDRRALEQQIDEAGLAQRVRLAGAVSTADALALIARAAVFALPCVISADGDRDALPTVLLEAMALGTPAVSTDVNGVPEMLGEGCGAVVGQHDPDGLAAAIDRLLASPAQRNAVAAAARQRMVERFDIRHNVAELKALFDAS
jgi:colanic acid/amylovoran biosynthesis glycosyltransferase